MTTIPGYLQTKLAHNSNRSSGWSTAASSSPSPAVTERII